MFCHNCGDQLPEGALFCQKCGERVVSENPVQEPAGMPQGNSAAGQMAATVPAGPAAYQAQGAPQSMPTGGKSKKSPLLIGAAVVAAVAVIFAVLHLNGGRTDDKDYEEEVQNQEPGDEEETLPLGEVSLTETFNDENTGISFAYPAEWVMLDSSGEFDVVEMIDSRNNADRIATFKVALSLDPDPYGVFTQDEASVRENVNESLTFLDLEDARLGDVPAKVLRYQTAGLKGDDTVAAYFYMTGDDTYRVTCSGTASAMDAYEPVFDAVMDSYRIDASAADSDLDGYDLGVDICFADIPVSELLYAGAADLIHQFGNGYHTNKDGVLSYDEIEFYMLDDETVGYIQSYYPEYFSINGHTLSADGQGVIDSDQVIGLLGTDYEDEWISDFYYKTYRYPACALSIGVDKFNGVRDIIIYNLSGEGDGSSGYGSDGAWTGYAPIEDYLRLAGWYIGETEQSSISLSIYTSQEEGEEEIGNADICVAYEGFDLYYWGDVIPVEKDVYAVMTDTGEEVLLVEEQSAGAITLQLYVDGQYIEEYRMKEHYES